MIGEDLANRGLASKSESGGRSLGKTRQKSKVSDGRAKSGSVVNGRIARS